MLADEFCDPDDPEGAGYTRFLAVSGSEAWRVAGPKPGAVVERIGIG